MYTKSCNPEEVLRGDLNRCQQEVFESYENPLELR